MGKARTEDLSMIIHSIQAAFGLVRLEMKWYRCRFDLQCAPMPTSGSVDDVSTAIDNLQSWMIRRNSIRHQCPSLNAIVDGYNDDWGKKNGWLTKNGIVESLPEAVSEASCKHI